MEIPNNLKNEIWDYCRANNITNIDDFTIKCLKQGFSVEKYGATPIERIVEKIVEVTKEVPIEKIVEVPMATIDCEISEQMKQQNELITQLREELLNVTNLSNVLSKQLEDEKKKHKKDIYGED